ncbi:MAG: hypothetical protein LBU12_09425 [Deltaproteobacteria bacterium]|jgi:hypothetical protein|nr:hypothetical protein [Deltaproteobacteria bacterium]
MSAYPARGSTRLPLKTSTARRRSFSGLSFFHSLFFLFFSKLKAPTALLCAAAFWTVDAGWSVDVSRLAVRAARPVQADDDLAARPKDQASAGFDASAALAGGAELGPEAASALASLMSVAPEDLAQSYLAQLDLTSVLVWRAAQERPDQPAPWRLLAKLAETKSLFVAEPGERAELLEEAASHLQRAARLSLDRDRPAAAAEPTPEPAVAFNDPYLAELVWASRLRRGEVGLEELKSRYAEENLEPAQRPDFWKDRFFLVLTRPGPAERAEALAEAQADFERLWADMPVEVPWRGDGDKFGPQKLKKIEILEAWTASLATLSGVEPDSNRRSEIFQQALDLYPLAKTLPLDRHELASFMAGLDRADALAPDTRALWALWALKDELYAHWLERAGQAPEIWAAWGRELYSRADRQPDDRIWALTLEEGSKKWARGVELGPEPGWPEWGRQLEFDAFSVSAYLPQKTAEERLARRRRTLELALEKYRQAYEREPDSLPLVQALARVLNKLSALSSGEELAAFHQESERLAKLAAGRDPDTAGAWFRRGLESLRLQRALNSGPEARLRLTAAAFADFRQCLDVEPPRADRLEPMADEIWIAASELPSLRGPALLLLADVCRGLTEADPDDPDYRFALGLALYALLAANRDWPDGLDFSDSLDARLAFDEVLGSFQAGLELLSVADRRPGRSWPQPADQDLAWPPLLAWGPAGSGRDKPRDGFLRPVGPSADAWLAGSSFQERLGSALIRAVARLLSEARPEGLSPWAQMRLAGFLRRAAASGWPPPQDQMALFRLGLQLLDQAQANLKLRPAAPAGASDVRPPLAAELAAEKGLLLAETSLAAPAGRDRLVLEARRLWDEADALAPGASTYARARWAAWTGGRSAVAPLLRHAADQQDQLLWPTFREAAFEPAFRAHHGQSWFKSAWFGYDR